MEYICSGYNSTHPSTFQINEVLEENFGHRFRMLLIKNDCFVQINDNVINNLEKNTLLLIQSGTFLHCHSNTDHYTDDWIEFAAELSEVEAFGISPDFVLSELTDEEIENLSYDIKRLSNEYVKRPLFYQEFCNTYLKTILIEVSRLLNSKTHTTFGKTSHALYRKLSIIRKQILDNVTHQISISDICEKNKISESHFRRSYKQVFNSTIQNDIIAKRISIAQKHLKSNHQLTVVQIADIVGYNSYEHFFRQFRKEVGLTPIEYRNRFTENIE